MIIKITLSLLALFQILSANIKVPDEFTISQSWSIFRTHFKILSSDGKQLAYVDKQFLKIPAAFNLYDNEGRTLSTAQLHFFSFGNTFTFSDNQGEETSLIKERLLTLLPVLDVLSPEGELIAEVQGNFSHTTYKMLEPGTGREIAVMERPFFGFLGDVWMVTLLDRDYLKNKGLKSDQIILMAVVQTMIGQWRAQAAQNLPRPRLGTLSSSQQESRYIALADGQAAKDRSLSNVKEKLNTYQEQVEGINPTVENFQAIDEMVAGLFDPTHGGEQMEPGLQGMINDLSHVFDELENRQLTPGEKAAFFILMKRMVEMIENQP